MSKKLEALKDAVFYAQQKPEVLATYLAGLISDVATEVTISGPDSVKLKADASVTADYTATAISQFGDIMSGTTPTLALEGSVSGVSISNGTVTLTKDVVATSFKVKATSGSATATMTVTIVPAAST